MNICGVSPSHNVCDVISKLYTCAPLNTLSSFVALASHSHLCVCVCVLSPNALWQWATHPSPIGSTNGNHLLFLADKHRGRRLKGRQRPGARSCTMNLSVTLRLPLASLPHTHKRARAHTYTSKLDVGC